MTSTSDKRYCAFCGTERRVYTKKLISLNNVFWSFILSVTLSILFWWDLDPKGLIIFPLLIGLCELWILLRWRLSITCNYCGFDPILYATDRPKVVEQVKKFRQEKTLSNGFGFPKKPYKFMNRLPSKDNLDSFT